MSDAAQRLVSPDRRANADPLILVENLFGALRAKVKK